MARCGHAATKWKFSPSMHENLKLMGAKKWQKKRFESRWLITPRVSYRRCSGVSDIMWSAERWWNIFFIIVVVAKHEWRDITNVQYNNYFNLNTAPSLPCAMTTRGSGWVKALFAPTEHVLSRIWEHSRTRIRFMSHSVYWRDWRKAPKVFRGSSAP